MTLKDSMEQYREGILRDLSRVTAVPSVRGEALPGKPFGEACAKVIDEAMDIAQALGLRVHNEGYYAMHAEIGEGEEYVAVLNHLDVVPAGDGWDTDPFVMTEQDGRLYGRGVADNKGPAIVSLYCLKALLDAGVPLKHRVRVILGADEECGSGDMKHYFTKHPLPLYGFTPDGGYPIYNREKGLLGLRFCVKGGNSTPIISIKAGRAHNMVPDLCEAVLAAGSVPAGMEALRDGDTASVVLSGKAAHAATPEEGINAAALMLTALEALYNDDMSPIARFLAFAHACIGTETDGASLGIRMSDAPSGPLTCNMGLFHTEGGEASLHIDIRYPVTASHEDIIAAARAAAAPYGVDVEMTRHSPPLYITEDSPLIIALCAAYKAATGEEAGLRSMGGGTYARSLNNRGVAFGASFGDDQGIHQPNESVPLESLMKHAGICVEAMAALGRG